MRVSLRARRKKWPEVIPIYHGRQCPECFAVVISWSGQMGHQEWHDAQNSAPDEAPADPGGYIIGGAMAPADVPEYHDDSPKEGTEEADYWTE